MMVEEWKRRTREELSLFRQNRSIVRLVEREGRDDEDQLSLEGKSADLAEVRLRESHRYMLTTTSREIHDRATHVFVERYVGEEGIRLHILSTDILAH